MSKPAIDPFLRYKMWVLVPHLETDDPNLQYYYDFSQSLKEYTRVFDELKADWQWQPVTMQSISQTQHADNLPFEHRAWNEQHGVDQHQRTEFARVLERCP